MRLGVFFVFRILGTKIFSMLLILQARRANFSRLQNKQTGRTQQIPQGLARFPPRFRASPCEPISYNAYQRILFYISEPPRICRAARQLKKQELACGHNKKRIKKVFDFWAKYAILSPAFRSWDDNKNRAYGFDRKCFWLLLESEKGSSSCSKRVAGRFF